MLLNPEDILAPVRCPIHRLSINYLDCNGWGKRTKIEGKTYFLKLMEKYEIIHENTHM